MERIARLIDAGDGDPHGEGVENEVLHSLELRRQHHDPGRAGAGDESLRGERDSEPAVRRADVVPVVGEARVELVHRVAAEGPGGREGRELCAANRQRVEARHIGAALLPGIRIVERVIVDEVVAAQEAEPGIAVDAGRAFVVMDGLRERAG